jgi:chorismate synthase
MRSTYGTNFQLTVFGESHGPAVGFVLDGLPAGIRLDLDNIRRELDKRRPVGRISTQRREDDAFTFLSGYYKERTTGTPLTFVIENKGQHSNDYEAMQYLPRPSHADYAAYAKYGGYQDPRGGGHFSGRITTGLVAAGAIFEQILFEHGIRIGTHVARCQEIADRGFDWEALDQDLDRLAAPGFPTLEEAAGEKMRARIEQAQAEGDSLGAVMETAVLGMPAGIGEPFFHSVESELSALLFSVPALKGVQFGLGFGFADKKGSAANDEITGMTPGRLVTRTNHNGGVNGGITNGMPIVFSTVIKPTASIYLPQQTVDVRTGEPETLRIRGRHDPAIFHRARAVIDAMAAIGLCDLMMGRYGYLWARKEGPCVTV